MKALTIRQPWASLIALGVKTIETRSWRTNYRGPLLIHAGKRAARLTEAEAAWDRLGLSYDDLVATLYPARNISADPLPLGAVVAVADLIDCLPIVDADNDSVSDAIFMDERVLVTDYADRPRHDISDQLPYGDFTPNRYGWLLDNVRPIDPIPAKGKQGLWAPALALSTEAQRRAIADDPPVGTPLPSPTGGSFGVTRPSARSGQSAT